MRGEARKDHAKVKLAPNWEVHRSSYFFHLYCVSFLVLIYSLLELVEEVLHKIVYYLFISYIKLCIDLFTSYTKLYIDLFVLYKQYIDLISLCKCIMTFKTKYN